MLTGENGILKRVESVKVVQSKAELTEKMQLAIMESLIDRENPHTIDNVLKIAEDNGYIAIDNTHRLMNAVPEESVLETSTETNKYVTEECETVLVVDVETGVWVELGQNGSDVTLEVGETLIKVESLRSLSVVATAGQLTDGKVTITVEAMLNDESSKEKSSIEKIMGPDGQEITTNKEVFDGSNGDKNLRVTYDVTENGNYTFTATEENGGKATKSIAVSEFDNVEEIEITSDTEKGEWTDEVNVTIEYDEWTNESLQYKVGTGSWQTAGNTRQVVTVTENTTIEARYGTDDTTKVTYTVAEIDDELPTPPEFTIEEIGTTSFKIKIGTKSIDAKSGLKEYQIYNGAEKIGTIGATATEHTVQNLTEGTTYLIKLVAVDEVGNEAESGVESVKTTEIVSNQVEVPSTKEDIEFMTELTTKIDDDENEFVIPGGFGISNESGDNITEGIVIEDAKGNQFVWVPVGENLKKADGTTQTIELGRYSTWGLNDSPVELDTVISTYFTEDTTDIKEFITEAEKNGGYYIGRYEAGALDGDGKITTNGSTARVSRTQSEAATEAKAMYSASETVESDLINSAAWDTAIMYIQKFSTATTYNATAENANAANDTYCKIWNMSSGVFEWSTETSSASSYPCVRRGGNSSLSVTTRYRIYYSTSASSSNIR